MDIFTLSGKILLEGKNETINGLDQVDKKAGSTESAFSKLGGTIAKIATAGGALFLAKKGFDMLVDGMQKGIEFIKDTVEEAGQQESALVRLNAILKATNQYTDENSRALIENSQALQNKTIYTDEEVLASEAQLAIYKLTKDEMLEATEVIADMAAATGQDLAGATMIVGKAMEGITTPLRRYGIILDETRLKTEGNSYVLEELRSRFKGVAEESANTADGLKKQIGNQLGELKETIGGAFLPTLKTLMDRFLHGTPIVDNFGQVIGNTASPLSKLQDWAQKAADKIKEFLDMAMEADYSKVVEGLEDIAQAVGWLAGDEGFDSMSEAYQGFVDKAGESLTVLSRLAGLLGSVVGLVTLSWASFQLFQSIGTSGFGEALKNWEEQFGAIGEGIKVFAEGVEDTTPKLDGFMQSAAATIQPTNDLAGAAQGSADSINNQGNAADATSEIMLGGYIQTITGAKEVLYLLNNETEIYYGKLMNQMVPGFAIAAEKARKFASDVDTTAWGMHAAAGKAEILKQNLDLLHDKHITVTTSYINDYTNVANIAAHMGKYPGAAEGGDITSAGIALVGENGPELLSLPTGARVTPLDTKTRNSNSPIVNIYPQWNEEFTNQTVLRLINQELAKVF